MAIRIPSRKRQDKYGYVQRGEGGAGSSGPLDVACPTLISPTNGEFVLQEQVTFSWGNVNGATSYNFYLWEESEAEPQPINTTSLTYSTTLTFGSTYRWRVNAVNDFGESAGCTYGLVFPSLPDGKSGYVEFEVNQGFVELEDDLYIVNDSEAFVTINIIRTGSSGVATVDYATADGTAVAPTNYTETSGTAMWANGVSGAYPVSIPIELLEEITELATDVLADWVEDGSADPREDGYTYDYQYNSVTYSTYEEAKAAAELSQGYALSEMIGWRRGTHGSPPTGISGISSGVTALEREFLSLSHSGSEYYAYSGSTVSIDDYNSTSGGNPYPFVGVAQLGIGVNTMFFGDITINQFNYAGLWYFLQVNGPSGDPAPPGDNSDDWIVPSNCQPPDLCPYDNADTDGIVAFAQPVTDIAVRRVPAPPPLEGRNFPDWEHCPEHFWYDEATDTLYSKEPWTRVDGSFRWLARYNVSGGGVSTVERKPMGPVLAVGDANDTQAFWTAAYNAAVAAGDLPSGMTYDATGTASSLDRYPKNATYAYTRTYKLPKRFTFGLSNAAGATIQEPDTATVWIVDDC